MPVKCSKIEAKEKETQPPKAYTEGTLLKAMEGAGKQVEDEELRDAMKDSGLGTPATRASVIERLKQVGYIVMQGKRIVITQKGRMAIELVRGAGVDLLTSPEMTGHWERRLNEIARGLASDEAFMANVKKFTNLIVDKVRVQSKAAKQAFEGDTPSAGAAKRTRKRGAAEEAAGGGDTAAPAAKRTRAARSGDAAGKAPASGSRTRRSAGPAAAEPVLAAASAPVPAGGRAAAPAATALPGIAACPRPGCRGRIIMGKRGYGCTEYKSGCGFVIWKDSFGAVLTDTAIRFLVEKGRTALMTLNDENGRPFKGRIILTDTTTGKLAVEAVTN